jgi:hypothetical protein
LRDSAALISNVAKAFTKPNAAILYAALARGPKLLIRLPGQLDTPASCTS